MSILRTTMCLLPFVGLVSGCSKDCSEYEEMEEGDRFEFTVVEHSTEESSCDYARPILQQGPSLADQLPEGATVAVRLSYVFDRLIELRR